jgi:hypothetical protein
MTYPIGTAAKVVEVALSEVGYVEEPENITKFGKFTKADGLPWCGSFVNWCFHEAGVKLPSMVGTAAGAHKLKEVSRWVETDPKIGDLAFMDFPHDGVDRISHIGIVVGVKPKSVITIEGNTSGSGDQRNGGMVMVKERAFGSGKEIVGFGRPKFVAYAGDYPVVEVPTESAAKPKKTEKKNGKLKATISKLGA